MIEWDKDHKVSRISGSSRREDTIILGRAINRNANLVEELQNIIEEKDKEIDQLNNTIEELQQVVSVLSNKIDILIEKLEKYGISLEQEYDEDDKNKYQQRYNLCWCWNLLKTT